MLINHNWLFILRFLYFIVASFANSIGSYSERINVIDNLFINKGPDSDVLREYESVLKEILELKSDTKSSEIYHSLVKYVPTLYYKIGLIEVSLNKEVNAIDDFQHCLLYDPLMKPARIRLADLFLERGAFESLSELISRNLQEDEKFKKSFDKMGEVTNMINVSVIAANEQNFDLCIKEISNAIEISPLNSTLHFIRISCTRQLFESNSVKDIDEGFKHLISSYTSLTKIQPMNLSNYDILSDILLYGENNFEKSWINVKQCLRIDNEFTNCKLKSKWYSRFSSILQVFEKSSNYYSHLLIDDDSELRNEVSLSGDELGSIYDGLFVEKPRLTKQESKTSKANNNFEILERHLVSFAKQFNVNMKDFRILNDLYKIACESTTFKKDMKLSNKFCSKLNNENFFAIKVPQIDTLLNKKKFEEANKIINSYNKRTRSTTLLKGSVEIIESYQQQKERAQQQQQQQQQRQQQQRQQQQRQQYFNQRQQPAKPKNDYYKILDVSRDADEKTIRKAYRDKTKQYHPDKFKGDLSQDEIENKMTLINHAYEVLSNKELRERYDRGDDPNDPSQPQQRRDPSQNFQFFRQGHGAPGSGGFKFDGFGNNGFNFDNIRFKNNKGKKRPF